MSFFFRGGDMTAVGADSSGVRLVAPDGGWGWVVLAAALVVNVLIPGTLKSFGVLFVEFMRVFEASPSEASWMPALCYFLYSSLGPLSSALSSKYSYRSVTLVGGTFAACGLMLSYFANSVTYLYFSYGILFGIGAGLCFPVTIYIVSEYFDRLRGLATGLTISGSCIGSVVLPPLLQWMLQHFGHRTAVLIMGVILLNTVAAAMFYQPVERHMRLEDQTSNEKESPSDVMPSPTYLASHRGSVVSMVGSVILDPRRNSRISMSRRLAVKQQHIAAKQREDIEEEKNDEGKGCLGQLSILKDPFYLVILASNATSVISNTNFILLLPMYAMSLGHDVESSALLLSLVSLLDLIGRCGGAALSDMNLVPKHYYFVSGLGLSGLALALLPFSGSSYLQLGAFCALFGLSSGLYIGTTAVVLADMLGPERLASSYGISLFVNGFCQLLGPPLCNLMYESIQSFQPIFTTLGIISIGGTALWATMPFIRRSNAKASSEPTAEPAV